MNIITGEKIQNVCDYYIGGVCDFNYNRIIKNQPFKHINIDDYNIEHIKTLVVNNIFCYTHLIDNENLVVILSSISTRFNLIFHNSDHCFGLKHKQFLLIPNVNKIFTQNLSTEPEERIIPIPIGIANRMWRHGNLNHWKQILETNRTQDNFIYFNFNIRTNTSKRKKCYDVMVSKNIPHLPNTDYLNYLKILASYKFAICPEGNGLDTHRFWECLYLKVIPICLKNHITEYYGKMFPIVLLDNWEDLKVEHLNERLNHSNWNNYDILNFESFSKTFNL